jgi:hypothetical protein
VEYREIKYAIIDEIINGANGLAKEISRKPDGCNKLKYILKNGIIITIS